MTRDLHSVNTALGRMGILICYDGFHESLAEHYDSLGVEIVLNPSHSDRNWEQPAARFLLAKTASHTGEEIVAATTDLPQGC